MVDCCSSSCFEHNEIPRRSSKTRRRSVRKQSSVLLCCSFLASASTVLLWIGNSDGFRLTKNQRTECIVVQIDKQQQHRHAFSSFCAASKQRGHHSAAFTRRRKHSTDLFSQVSDVEDQVYSEVVFQNGTIELLPEFDSKNGHLIQPKNGKSDRVRIRNGFTKKKGSAKTNNTVALANSQHRSMWRRRNARSAEEGIRREKTTQLSTILAKAAAAEAAALSAAAATSSKRYAARTIAGLINALAEEVHDLEVEVESRQDTPLWDKHIDEIRIKFSRLGFKPLKISGLAYGEPEILHRTDDEVTYTVGRQLTELSSADEAFARIDVDNSGALDRDEIVEALTLAAGQSLLPSTANNGNRSDTNQTEDLDSQSSFFSKTNNEKIEFLRRLASELVDLYDFNGDGVVDRLEYQSMVEDMAALRELQEEEERQRDEREKRGINDDLDHDNGDGGKGWFSSVGSFFSGIFRRNAAEDEEVAVDSSVSHTAVTAENTAFEREFVNGARNSSLAAVLGRNSTAVNGLSDVVNAEVVEEIPKTVGSITLTDLKLDLRRLVFGAIPVVKHITPGGPLVLEPFTATITGSFSRDDIRTSFLLDLGLRRLVAQVLRRRVRSLRDMMDFAVFYGRSWKMSSRSAPLTEVLELTDVEFDRNNKLIITGRVRIQSRQDQPVVENSFKLRTRIGTGRRGRTIRLVEPELALVLECPKNLEKSIVESCQALGLKPPKKPKPIYSFFPIYSPFKLEENENEGFDLGEDNRIKSIYIEDNALRFELSAVLRPGRFLGNHYLAFTIPIRTFIITLDRVKEGMRAARKTKKEAKALKEAAERNAKAIDAEGDSATRLIDELDVVQEENNRKKRRLTLIPLGRRRRQRRQRQPPKSFFSRFVDGYLRDREDDESERVTTAIRDFFGNQSTNSTRRTAEV